MTDSNARQTVADALSTIGSPALGQPIYDPDFFALADTAISAFLAWMQENPEWVPPGFIKDGHVKRLLPNGRFGWVTLYRRTTSEDS